MAGFKNMAPDSAVVVRGGQRMDVAPQELVVGDVVLLASGRNAPADVRIIHCNGLKCDFSSLTGESEAIRMQVSARERRERDRQTEREGERGR
jgi:Ca2+-transporting ATPase